MNRRVIIALDVSSREEALHLLKQLRDLVGMFKVGSQLFMTAGPSIVQEIIGNGGNVFLDLKFHDIPNTVTQAAVEAAKLGVSMMTVHAAGGRAMMEAIARELGEKFGDRKPRVVAVTVLTSLDTRALFEMGWEQPVDQQVERLALLAQDLADGRGGIVHAAVGPIYHQRTWQLVQVQVGQPDDRGSARGRRHTTLPPVI